MVQLVDAWSVMNGATPSSLFRHFCYDSSATFSSSWWLPLRWNESPTETVSAGNSPLLQCIAMLNQYHILWHSAIQGETCSLVYFSALQCSVVPCMGWANSTFPCQIKYLPNKQSGYYFISNSYQKCNGQISLKSNRDQTMKGKTNAWIK